MKGSSGYSLLEMVIVIVVISIAGTAVAVNLPAMFVSLNIEQVTARIAVSMAQARREAIKGNMTSRTFDLQNTLEGNRQGITVTERAPESKRGCQGGCGAGEQTICVSGRPFCYRESTRFTYERFSGELSAGRAVFLVSKSRKFAVFVSPDGKSEIAELVNGEWQSRTKLQNLQPLEK